MPEGSLPLPWNTLPLSVLPPSLCSYASYLVWKDLGGGFGRPLVLPLGLYAVQLAISWTVLILFFVARTHGLVRHAVFVSGSSVGAGETTGAPRAESPREQCRTGR